MSEWEIVLGPPGTGKTTTLLGIVDEELGRGTEPDRVGYVSFTRRAAGEAVERATDKFSLSSDQLPHFRTLHSLCYRELGLRRGDVLDGKLLQEFADYAGVRITGRFSEDGTFGGVEAGDRAIFVENVARVRQVSLRDAYEREQGRPGGAGVRWSELERIALALASFKEARGLLDYTDMLAEFLRTGAAPRLEVLLVDEAQDLSALQWRVVELLARGARRVVVAGDDDQAIYAWAGADVAHLVNLRGSARVLGQSWRVPRRVQAVADKIIHQVAARRPKEWRPRAADGSVERLPAIDKADLDGDDVLILARNTWLLDPVEDELRFRGMIYERNGRSSIRPSLMEAATTWERLRRGEAVPVALARSMYEWMSSGRGVARGHKQLPGWADDELVSEADLRGRGGLLASGPWFEALDRLPPRDVAYVRAARQRGEKLSGRPRVRLATIHTAKGAEADRVVLLLQVAPAVARSQERAPDDELRCWYVAVTRARERLTMVDSPTPLRCRWL